MTTETEAPADRPGGAKPFARSPEAGEARWWLGSLAIIKAGSDETGGAFTLVEVHESESDTPLHVHHNEDETFWVLEGEVVFTVGEETVEAGPGTMLFGPRGIPHGYTVRRGPARMLFLLTPGGFEKLVLATSQPAGERRIPRDGEGMVDMETLPDIVRRYGCEFV